MISGGWIFLLMFIVCVAIIVWNAGTHKENHLSTEEIIAESRRKYNLDV